MTYLVGDIIARAFRLAGIIGVGQRMSADDMQTATDALTDILAQWQVERWLVYSLTTTSLTSTGQMSYTVGPGQDFNMVRPDRIEAAYFRFFNTGPTTVDRMLKLINSREDYNAIAVKNIGSFPDSVYYENSFPVGLLYFWPLPIAGQSQLFVTTKTTLPIITDMTQLLDVPPEYIAPLRYELASVLRSEYTMPVDPKLEALLIKGNSILRNANAQIPTLRIDALTPGAGHGWYNPYSDGNS